MSKEIELVLQRGVVDVTVRQELEKKLKTGKPLRVKFGIDPTGSDLHLGHLVPLRKLAQFQKMGHHIILLFGTFTGKIGDPTGKDKMRTPLTDAEIEKNMQTYLDQAAKVLDIQNAEIVQNGDWLGKMTFSEVLELAGCFTASQMMQRDMFQRRLANEQDINLVEFFYPLMQGYDSVAVKADVEIGGTDQLFNLMAGRKIQEKFHMPPQDILTVPILEGTSGSEKMSKSLGNYIAVYDSPRDVFGKTMSIPDSLVSKYFELLTDIPQEEITDWITNRHPRDAKIALAENLVTLLHSSEEAQNAQEEFFRMFSEKGVPDQMPEEKMPTGEYSALEIVIASGLCASNSEARRMIQQGAVKWNGEKVSSAEEIFSIGYEENILQVGKRKFCKIQAE
jgi:tyrosyl-tRNA synthetase